MAMRMTGLVSGLDTESIIQELVSAKQTKVDDAVKAQKKLSWKQDKWKELNTKLKSLQSKYLSNMRFASSYSKKTTKVSNSSAVNIITGDSAMNGVQELQINQLAKTSYMTGGKVSYTALEEGSELSAVSALETLGIDANMLGESGEATFTVKAGSATKTLTITKDTTISDVLNTLKDAGLNANFDAKQQRFYVSAKESGEANNFSMECTNAAVLDKLGMGTTANKIDGTDAEIVLNGAIYTSSTNVFDINGLTITALDETKGDTITITTQDDVDGIYDMVKNFLKEYNAVINEIDKLYNADSAKDYEPLTDEEREAMSESEAEKYEDKIKDALLRHDSSLSSIGTALKGVMSAGIEVNGKTMYLSDFGIETLGYFEAADNEKNAYHIAGDPDDEDSSSDADVLKSMISTDPDTVISFFSQLSKNLYGKMDKMSSSVDGYRSFGSFYDDKKMKSDYDDYTTKIAELEEKLADYEDKLYEKYAAMETALAKMQSNSNAVTSLLGG